MKPLLEMPGDKLPLSQPMHPSCTHPCNVFGSLVTFLKRRNNSHTQEHLHMAEGLLCWGKREDVVSYKKRNNSWNLEPNHRKRRATRKVLIPSLCHLTCIITVYTGSFLGAEHEIASFLHPFKPLHGLARWQTTRDWFPWGSSHTSQGIVPQCGWS